MNHRKVFHGHALEELHLNVHLNKAGTHSPNPYETSIAFFAETEKSIPSFVGEQTKHPRVAKGR